MFSFLHLNEDVTIRSLAKMLKVQSLRYGSEDEKMSSARP